MPAGITRASRTVLDSQGAFVAGNTRRTVRRTPTNCFGPGRRDSGPSGREPPGGRLEPWWCTPTTSGSRASRGRGRRQRRPRSCRERRALRAVCRVAEDRVGSAARTSPPKVAGRQQLADRSPLRPKLAFGPSQGEGGDGQRVSWSRDEVRGVRVAEDRVGSASGAPPPKAARREQPAGRSAPSESGLRATRR
jgi:hypothetical protein